ncbi:MAG: P1 family peptidase [Gemmatimonadetes bacterium]|nr:P1 family peptidase [Gemmatimonadota bacterium]
MTALPPGVMIGHATDTDARTGCTVLIGPFRGACHVCGHATGTREIDALSPIHIVPRIDALLLTGGSAFGLGAADGVVAWLESHGRGFDVGVARVPIVPAAVIFDLAVAKRRPDATMGRAACEAATVTPPATGRVGAGTGATVGKWLGPAGASPGGLGCHSTLHEAWTITALAVVNALGDIIGATGEVLAGARDANGDFAGTRLRDLARFLPGAGATSVGPAGAPGASNTTLAAIVTDAPLSRTSLEILARMASAALARRISPAFTPFDGDIVFALSTADAPPSVEARELVALGAAATLALEEAIALAVTA